MTEKNKLIVGGVVVVLVAYYLYDRNKKMKAKQDLVAGAEVSPGMPPEVMPVGTGGIKPTKTTASIDEKQDLSTSMR